MSLLERYVRTPRAVRARRRLAISAVAFALVPFGPQARGDAPPFAGFTGKTTAAGIAFFYDQPSAGVPSSPTAELSVAIAQSVLESGPSAYGLASNLWPGSLIANVPPVITGEAHKQGLPPEVPDLPAYPVRAETFHPQGPETQRSDLAGGTMESKARADAAEARAAINSTLLPGALSAGTVSSFAESVLEERGIVSRATAAAQDVSIMNGLIRIGSVVSTAEAVSDGRTAAVTGGVTVGIVKIANFVLSIDEHGLHGIKVMGQEPGPETSEINEAANEILDDYGVTISVAGPIDIVEGASGSRSLGGLLVNFRSEALQPFVDALPEDLRREFEKYVSLDQTFTIVIAGVSVGAAATPLPPLPDFSFPPPQLPAPPPPQVLGEQFLPPPGAAPSIPAPTTGATPQGPARPVGAPIEVPGVPPWSVALALVAALVGGNVLRRSAERMLTGRVVTSGCPYSS